MRFSSRQVTLIVVTALLVSVPGTVWAVDSFTNVAVMDPVSGRKAAVDSTRKLAVSDGDGRLTVDGSVTARPGPPHQPVAISGPASSGTCAPVYTVPAGRALVLRTASVNYVAAGGRAIIDLAADTAAGSCAVFAQASEDDARGTMQLDFGEGFVVGPGKALRLQAPSGTGYADLFGYLVPASAVPPSVVAAAAEGGARRPG